MKSPLLKEIYRLSGVIIPFAAMLLSMMVFLSQAGKFEYLKYVVSISGALIGGLFAYLYASVRSALRAPKVYISYSRKDEEVVAEICKALENIRVEVLLDKNELLVGDDVQKKLESLVQSCDYIIYVHSANSAHSMWSINELQKALSSDKKVLPVVVDDEPLPNEIKNLMYADFRHDRKDAINRLKKVFANIKHNNAM